MWKVSMYVLYVCVDEGIRVKYIYLGSFLICHVSEICVKQICVNHGFGVFCVSSSLVQSFCFVSSSGPLPVLFHSSSSPLPALFYPSSSPLPVLFWSSSWPLLCLFRSFFGSSSGPLLGPLPVLFRVLFLFSSDPLLVILCSSSVPLLALFRSSSSLLRLFFLSLSSPLSKFQSTSIWVHLYVLPLYCQSSPLVHS